MAHIFLVFYIEGGAPTGFAQFTRWRESFIEQGKSFITALVSQIMLIGKYIFVEFQLMIYRARYCTYKECNMLIQMLMLTQTKCMMSLTKYYINHICNNKFLTNQ